MKDQARETFKPGQRVIVTQQIPQRDKVLHARVEGEVMRFERRKTGSWYAHAKDHKLWLDRLVLRKDDGEIVQCILDAHTRIEVIPPRDASSDAIPAAAGDDPRDELSDEGQPEGAATPGD